MDSILSVENKNLSGDGKSLRTFLELSEKPKVVHTDNSLEFGKACEDLSWNHSTSTLHRSETNGIAERSVRRVKEGTSAVLLQSSLDENWWADSMECHTYLRNIQDLLSDGKTPYERRFGKPFKRPIIPFGSLVEYYPITAKEQSRIHQFGKKVLPGIFLGYEVIAKRIWKGDFSDSRFGRIRKLNASEIHPRRLNAKEVLLTPKRWWIHFPSNRWYSKIVRKRLRIPRIHSQAGTDRMEWRSQWKKFKAIGESLNRRKQQMTLKPVPTSGRFKETVVYRHHNELRVQLHVPKEETFPIPLKYTNVTRSTHTDLDVMQENVIDDYWNVDENRSLSDSWKGFTKFTLLQEKPLKGYMWSGRWLTKI